ncbi:MAG TPA: trigger factor [Bacteroidota bacterium]|nr:trigger factor [Bacteroidota bacterium]
MQVTITSVSEIQQQAEIQLTQEEIQPLFERAYEKFRPKVELRGFRKGKVPMPMIKQLYGEAIERDALDDIASDFYRKAMQERNIQLVGQPTVVDMDFKRGEHLRFSIKYEVKPAITLGRYTGVAVEKPVHIVTDAEVDAEIRRIQKANSASAEAASVTGRDFIVTADVQELDETGSPLIGKKTVGARFDLSDDSLEKEIRDSLASAETAQKYRAHFTSQHGDHTHAVHIDITPTKIEQVTLPPFDEALVSKITGGKLTSVEEFRSNLRRDIERYWNEDATAQLNENIARQIVGSHSFAVPDSIVESVLDSYIEDIRNRSRERKLPRGFDEKAFRAESRDNALWQAKWILLKERIAEQEHITVSDAEIEALAESEAQKIGIEKDRLLQYYRSSSGAMDRLLSEKLMAFLRANAKVTDTIRDTHAAHT